MNRFNAGFALILRQLNPHVNLPNLPIKVVVRADGSGTTYNFSDYLAKVSPEWKSRMGVSSSLAWPAGFIAVKGSDGMVKSFTQTSGAISYVDYNYVLHGDTLARTAKFVPLPDRVQGKAYRAIAALTDDKGQPIGLRVLGDKQN